MGVHHVARIYTVCPYAIGMARYEPGYAMHRLPLAPSIFVSSTAGNGTFGPVAYVVISTADRSSVLRLNDCLRRLRLPSGLRAADMCDAYRLVAALAGVRRLTHGVAP